MFKSEHKSLKSVVNDQLGINIGDPSEMVTGGSFKKFSTETARVTLTQFIKDDSKKESFAKIHLQLCAIVLVINSQKRKIKGDSFRVLCTDTYLEIRKTFPWAIISKSLHRILGHSWERIQMNGMKGLGSESEEGLEAFNKLIRFYRAHSSRTISTEANVSDTFNHLWRLTSPLIAEMEREKRKRTPKLKVLQELDSLIVSLFVSEEEETDS